jgi:acyl-CoA thioesterase FadM
MHLWFRLLWLLMTARFRAALVPPDGVSRLNFRVWPTDCDTNLHMNNGRYLTLCDLGRTDLMLRSSLWRVVLKNGWMPVLSGAIVRYRRELKPFRAFALESRIVFWNDRNFVMEHRFVAEHHGHPDVAAIALVRGGLYDRKARRFIDPHEIFRAMGYDGASPEASKDIAAFMLAEDEMKRQQGSVIPEG